MYRLWLPAELKTSSRLCCHLQGGFDISQYRFRTRHRRTRQIEVSQPSQGGSQSLIGVDQTWQPGIKGGVDRILGILKFFQAGGRFPSQIHECCDAQSANFPCTCILIGLS